MLCGLQGKRRSRYQWHSRLLAQGLYTREENSLYTAGIRASLTLRKLKFQAITVSPLTTQYNSKFVSIIDEKYKVRH